MAKTKLVLAVAPTFKATVGIPVPGAKDTVAVEFTFRHRTKSQLKQWREGLDLEVDGITAEHVLDMATGWDLDDPFDAESIGQMLEVYPGSGIAIFVRYATELQDAKLGNSAR